MLPASAYTIKLTLSCLFRAPLALIMAMCVCLCVCVCVCVCVFCGFDEQADLNEFKCPY